MDAKTTGRFLAELRKEKGYTQKELGDKLMVTDKAISRWETGKGLPDTALLKPLSEILGVSVGELLAGKRVPPEQTQDETDSIVVEVVRHSRHIAARAAGFCLVIVGILLLLTPLVVTTQSKSGVWALGFAPIGAAVCLFLKKDSGHGKLLYWIGMGCLVLALILELLPFGAVMVMAPNPTERIMRTFSFFDLNVFGYGNFFPLLAGLLTVFSLLIGLFSAFRPLRSLCLRNAVFRCTEAAAVLSFAQILFGMEYLSVVGALVCVCLFLSAVLQRTGNSQASRS